MSRLFVGNIPFACTENDLHQWFEAQGYEVTQVELIQDKLTGQPRGFGFVELRVAWKTEDAIRNLHQKDFGGRKLTVNMATPIGSNRKSDAQSRTVSGK
jgi:cold-inducible RNA-binding protein